MVDFVLDFGNARWKWFFPKQHKYADARHALAMLSEADWRRACGNGKPPSGILRVNGQPLAFGDAARRYTLKEKPRGAARYTQQYYGFALACALSETFSRDMGNITLFASHAPGDVEYARDIVLSAKGIWQVETRNGEFTYQVREVMTADEPIAGYSHYTLTERGEERKKNPLRDVTTLVLDCGGHTTDVAAVDPGGNIDTLSLKSTRAGVINMTNDFESMLRANNRTLFRDAGDLDIRRVEDAILNGRYKFGNITIDCQEEAGAVMQALVNDVIQIIEEAGGAANFDNILLTGGGAALIHDALVQSYPRIDFIFAEQNRDLMKFANVFGLAKVGALMRLVGAW
jgi:hypothetical protein